MKLTLPYGERGLDVEVPNTATVLIPEHTTPVPDEDAAVRAAIAEPLGSPPLSRMAGAGQKAAIVVSDVTRPVPNTVILPPILATLEAAGVARDDITIVVGTGLHRPSRPDEHRRLLGDAILDRYRVVDHVAKDRSTQEYLWTTPRGT